MFGKHVYSKVPSSLGQHVRFTNFDVRKKIELFDFDNLDGNAAHDLRS